jgi:hypothetical protein
VTQDHEHDEGDEAAQAPVSTETVLDEEQAEEEAHEAETPPAEPAEASAPPSEKEIEKANRALEKEATAHANRISKIMGEDAQALVPCELCWPLAPGFHWPADVAPIDDEQRAAILAAIGMGDGGASILNDAKGVHECESCSGYGLLAFPTKVQHVKEQQCPACTGSGYVLDAQREAVPLYVAPQQNVTTTAAPPTVPACPVCEMTGMAGLPHFCNPVAASG